MKSWIRFWNVIQTRWIGSFLILIFWISSYTLDPLLHVLVSWWGSWWCYRTILQGYNGKGRLVVGYFCWMGTGYTLMSELDYYSKLAFIPWMLERIV